MSNESLNQTIHSFTYNDREYQVDLLKDSCTDQSNLWSYDIFDITDVSDGEYVGQVTLKTTTPEHPSITELEQYCWDEIDEAEPEL